MKEIYCDAGFAINNPINRKREEEVARGKIAVVSEEFRRVDVVAIGRVPRLKQYINLFELIAIARAVEFATLQQWEKNIRINTDSHIAMIWASSMKVSKNVETPAHINALEYLARARKQFGGLVTIYQIPRDINKAGILLEDSQENERANAIIRDAYRRAGGGGAGANNHPARLPENVPGENLVGEKS